jgi:glycosyltransferase involved in cell wall biosynthesis
MESIAVVIPAYNEAPTIRDLATRALAQCARVIVIDDGSTDGTAACLADMPITLIRHERNLRKAAALWRGMQVAVESGADAVVTLDGDGQHRPEDLPILIEAAHREPRSIVIGQRIQRRDKMPPGRYLANRFADFWISWAAGRAISDSQSGFRLYPTSLIEKLDLDVSATRGFVFESEILIEGAKQGFEICGVGIPTIYESNSRSSHFRPIADVAQITLMVAGRLVRARLFLPGLYWSSLRPLWQRLAPPTLARQAYGALLLSFVALALTCGAFFAWLVYRVNRTAYLASTTETGIDAVVVLGHRLVDSDLSKSYRLRLDRALALCSTNPCVDVFIVGGGPNRRVTEADSGYRYLVDKGVDPTRMFRETLSRDTMENLSRIRPKLLSHKRIALVSNRSHLERVLTIAAHMRVPLVACGAERRFTFAVFRRSFVEAFVLHWYWTGKFLTGLARRLFKPGKMRERV